MIKAVIFDLDGVLVSTDALHFTAWKKLAEELGIPDFTEKDNLRQRGVGRMESLEVLLEKSDRKFSEREKRVLAKRKNNIYVSLLRNLSPGDILPGALDFLDALKRRGILAAVGSGSRNAPEILRRTGLDRYFDAVICGLDITRSKPDPQVFLMAAERLHVPPFACMVVEDSDSGVRAAKAGGMIALAVGSASRNAEADYRAASLEHLRMEEIFRASRNGHEQMSGAWNRGDLHR